MHLKELLRTVNSNAVCIDGEWVPARMMTRENATWRGRIRSAWMVLTGRADIVTWPGNQ